MSDALKITVIGAGTCDAQIRQRAFEVGLGIAEAGAILLCGGRGGVMEAAASGARSAGGLVVGVLPGASEGETPPNEHVQVALYTGIGQARNLVLVLSGDAVVAVAGGWGTLSEIAMALKHEVPVVLLDSWELERPDGRLEACLLSASTPAEAVETALEAARERRRRNR